MNFDMDFKACKWQTNVNELCISYSNRPKFGMVVVKKRIQNRLFAKDPRGNDFANPPPGTVCDTAITKPEW